MKQHVSLVEVEHGVLSSGYTRLFSTHTVTSLTDTQKDNTKHRYDTDYILFSTADSDFSARRLAPYIWMLIKLFLMVN